jgi:hypothetical protein
LHALEPREKWCRWRGRKGGDGGARAFLSWHGGENSGGRFTRQRLESASTGDRSESGGRGLACGAGGAAAQNRGGGSH